MPETEQIYVLIEVVDGSPSTRVGIGEKGLKSLLRVFKACIRENLQGNDYTRTQIAAEISEAFETHPDPNGAYSWSPEFGGYDIVVQPANEVFR